MKKLNLEKLKMDDPKFKKFYKKYKKQYLKKYDDIHDKLTFKKKRKTNPVIAVFGALTVLGLLFCGLASFFFAFFANMYGKKAENYMILNKEKNNEENDDNGDNDNLEECGETDK